jgi:succinyl-CoA synthetase beta subunit
MVVRMIGTNEEEAKQILEANGIFCMDSMEAAIKKVVE